MIDERAPDGCPLCGRATPGAGDLRAHLLVNHRKSELTDELLALAARRERPPAL